MTVKAPQTEPMGVLTLRPEARVIQGQEVRRLVAIGGGSGLSNLLRGFQALEPAQPAIDLTAIVAVSDDGGSSGRLRAAFGMPAPGDLCDCLAALTRPESVLSGLLQYRFRRGAELSGHTFGNLLITTLMESEGDFARAIGVLSELLELRGRVYPVTAQPVVLKALKASGHVVLGESRVAQVPGPVARVSLEPEDPRALPEVVHAISDAHLTVLGPGSLFTSTLPPLLVPDVQQALNRPDLSLVYVCNIMTEAGETDTLDAFEHVDAIFRHLGRYPDCVVVNTQPPSDAHLEAYAREGAEPVQVRLEPFAARGISVAAAPLLERPHGSACGPARHDPARLAHWLTDYALNLHARPHTEFNAGAHE